VLVANDVGIMYVSGGSETWAVRHAFVRIAQGEMVILEGPSGSGKSSLLYILSGIRPPSEGQVLYCGQPIGRPVDRQTVMHRYTEFGFVFQQHFLVGYLTATENACFGRRRSSVPRAREILTQFGLGSKLNAYPRELSHGERQRVAVARALVHEPRIVFADEPTASVDTELAHEICQWLKAYCGRGNSCIMVTHDSRLRMYADRIYAMEDGVVSESSQSQRTAHSGVRALGGRP
jgi:putative ABC transport system ATP-binding protein